MPRASAQHRLHLLLFLGLGLAFLCWFWSPLLFAPGFGPVDNDFFLAWQLAVNDALRDGHLLHWNPYFCGGTPGLANPQSGGLAPLNVLGLWMGPVGQFKVEVFLFAAAGLLGPLLLCRSLKISPLWGLPGVVVLLGNGFITFRLLNGQSTYLPFFLVPILGALMLAEAHRLAEASEVAGESGAGIAPAPRALLAGVLLLVLLLLSDGFLVLVYAGFFLGLLALFLSLGTRSPRPLVLIVIWIAAAAVLAMPRLLPGIELMSGYPRPVETLHATAPGLQSLYHLFLDPNQLDLYWRRKLIAGTPLYMAKGGYVGAIPFLLALYYLVRGQGRLRLAWVPVLLVALSVVFGAFASWAPWTVLRELPVLNLVDRPGKLVAVVIWCLALMSVLGARQIYLDLVRVQRLARRGRAVQLAVILVVGGPLAADLGLRLRPVLSSGVRPRQPAHLAIDRTRPFSQVLAPTGRMFSAVAANKGVLNCYRVVRYPVTVAPGRPLAYLAPGRGSGRVSARMERDAIRLEVTLRTPGRVLVNQNYHPYWSVRGGEGRVQRDRAGRMFVDLPAGERAVVLEYVPHAFSFGLTIALVGLLAAGLFGGLWLLRRRGIVGSGK